MVVTISISGSARSPGGGHGNPLQYSSLENPRLPGGAWRGTVHMVAKSQTWLKWLSMHRSTFNKFLLNTHTIYHSLQRLFYLILPIIPWGGSLVPFTEKETLTHKTSVPCSRSQSKYLDDLVLTPQLEWSQSPHDVPWRCNSAPKVPTCRRSNSA